jgi:hypothetical protein
MNSLEVTCFTRIHDGKRSILGNWDREFGSSHCVWNGVYGVFMVASRLFGYALQ